MPSIILLFSHIVKGNDASGAVRNLTEGDTEVAAGIVQSLTGAELFQMKPAGIRTAAMPASRGRAQNQRRDARPELLAYPETMGPYETAYLAIHLRLGGERGLADGKR